MSDEMLRRRAALRLRHHAEQLEAPLKVLLADLRLISEAEGVFHLGEIVSTLRYLAPAECMVADLDELADEITARGVA